MNLLTASPLPAALDARSVTANDLLAQAHLQFREHRMVRVQNFLCDVTRFIEFVSSWGTPLPYYAANGVGVHPEHDAIHHVRYNREAAIRGELHALDGPLSVHSAQSLRDPRPSCFAMLMVDPGWRDGEPGTNGESLLVRWRDVVVSLTQRDQRGHAAALERLAAPVPFPDDLRRPLIYPLVDASDEHDLGFRMKYGLLDLWTDRGFSAEAGVLRTVLAHAEFVAQEVALNGGELIVVDNDRWAHGRRAVRGQRTDGGEEVNPRELWSITVG